MTIKDISALTGYSVGTISRALNNQPNVSEKAKTTILRVAAENGFQLNANAKQLKQQHGNSILVVVKGTSNELFSSLVEMLQSHTDAGKYPLIVDYMDEGENEVLRALRLCVEKKPLGILKAGAAADVIVMDYKPFTPFSDENIDGHILFGMMGKNCRTTVINGRVLYKDREFVDIDEEAINAWTLEQSKKLWGELNHRQY